MTTEMICPKCATEMTTGYVLDRGDNAVKRQSLWVEGEPEKSFWMGLKTSDRDVYTIRTFRCPKCNYLEFYTAEQVDI